MKTNNITIVIITYNEALHIGECLQSAKYLSNDILVVDTESTDTTKSIVHHEKIDLVSFPYRQYVEPARNFAISQAKGPWVLILDADERITPELAKEINNTVVTQSDITHYRIPRKNIFGKTWLTHGGWWPDTQIRLIKKISFRKWPEQIHATPVIVGKQKVLNHPLIHLFHGDIEQMVKKTILFENIESDLLYQAHRQVSIITFFRKFLGELYRRLIRQLGFLDGKIGIIESIYQAFSKTITYLFLYEKSRTI